MNSGRIGYKSMKERPNGACRELRVALECLSGVTIKFRFQGNNPPGLDGSWLALIHQHPHLPTFLLILVIVTTPSSAQQIGSSNAGGLSIRILLRDVCRPPRGHGLCDEAET
jgi:hypothetical protein